MKLFQQQPCKQSVKPSHQRALLCKALLLSLCISLASCTTIAVATVDAVGSVAVAGIKTTAKVAVATVETAADVTVAGKRATVYVGTAVAGAVAAQAANSAARSAQEAAYTNQSQVASTATASYNNNVDGYPNRYSGTYQEHHALQNKQRYYEYSIYRPDPPRTADSSLIPEYSRRYLSDYRFEEQPFAEE